MIRHVSGRSSTRTIRASTRAMRVLVDASHGLARRSGKRIERVDVPSGDATLSRRS